MGRKINNNKKADYPEIRTKTPTLCRIKPRERKMYSTEFQYYYFSFLLFCVFFNFYKINNALTVIFSRVSLVHLNVRQAFENIENTHSSRKVMKANAVLFCNNNIHLWWKRKFSYLMCLCVCVFYTRTNSWQTENNLVAQEKRGNHFVEFQCNHHFRHYFIN